MRKLTVGISVASLTTYLRHVALAVPAMALVLGISKPMAAQLTLGTVSGSVRDAQAGVVPGARVSLISESRGSRLPEAVSTESGDFVIPNVPPDTYTLEIGVSFQNGAGNQNITGSPDFGGRVTVRSNSGSGCSSDIYRQFNASAFTTPTFNSAGLESGVGYLRGCFYQQFDLALQRNFSLGESRRLSLRIDAFNAFNQSHVTGRNTTMTVTSPTDPTIQNLPFDSSGNLIATRAQPKTAGFGEVNAYQAARTLQAWLRFTF